MSTHPAPFDGMERHLREAIVLNRSRAPRYAALTQGASDALFRRLILSEGALLPLARLVDRWAAPFVAQGIPVVVDDFVPMARVPAFGRPIEPCLPMGTLEAEAARSVLRRLHRDSALGLPATVLASAAALRALHQLEEAQGLRYPMSVHLVESLGLCALHGIAHNSASGGETAALVATLVGLQRLGLVTLDPVDIYRRANRFHQEGLGIIVNEVPAIPFQAELRAA